jgi:hypothetical protein
LSVCNCNAHKSTATTQLQEHIFLHTVPASILSASSIAPMIAACCIRYQFQSWQQLLSANLHPNIPSSNHEGQACSLALASLRPRHDVGVLRAQQPSAHAGLALLQHSIQLRVLRTLRASLHNAKAGRQQHAEQRSSSKTKSACVRASALLYHWHDIMRFGMVASTLPPYS